MDKVTFCNVKYSPKRIYGLDILRAFAILFVVIGHGLDFFPAHVGSMINHYFIFDGVSIFFVLSGFLIGGILIKLVENNEGKLSFSQLLNFMKRRWYRTLPNYYFILTVLVIIQVFANHDYRYGFYSRYYLFLQNFNKRHLGYFHESWSLSIEEWFYLTVPFLLFILINTFRFKTKKVFLYLIIFIIVLFHLFRFYRYKDIIGSSAYIENFYWNFSEPVTMRLDSIVFGVLGAYFFYYKKSSFLRNRVILLIIGFLILITRKFFLSYLPFDTSDTSVFLCVFSFDFNAIGSLLLIPFFSQIKTGKGILFNFFTFVSLISYSMYLTHYTLIKKWLLGFISLNNYMEYLIYWILTIAFSVLLYKYLEIPFMKMRNNENNS